MYYANGEEMREWVKRNAISFWVLHVMLIYKLGAPCCRCLITSSRAACSMYVALLYKREEIAGRGAD